MSDSNIPGGPKNHLEEFDEYLKTLPPVYGRKLLFSEKCGLAYALKKGERADVVADAFNLSRATISWLAHCLQPMKKHYADVWQEWQRLGEDAFRERYFTPELFFRLKRVRLKLLKLDENKTDRASRREGPDPRADKYAFKNHGFIDMPDETSWKIYWRQHEKGFAPEGWYFAQIDQALRRENIAGVAEFEETTNNDYHPIFRGVECLHGRENHEPFRTSTDAFDGLYEFMAFPNPRPKPGRKKFT